MPNRSLARALRDHLTCTHSLSLSVNEQNAAITHDGGTYQFIIPDGSETERGSALFHEWANRLAGLEGHVRAPLSISDEEYAGFLNA